MSLPMPKRVPKAGFYWHYKHNPAKGVRDYAYEVVSVGFHTEDDVRPGEAHFVNYRPLYLEAAVYKASKELGIECTDNRPLEMWMGEVTKDDQTFPRFQMITDPTAIAELEKARDEMY
jgi:hypothetical protein